MPLQAVGKPHTLWAAFAKFYEKHGDLKNARIIFEKGCGIRYKYVDDLASLWCEWAEMELRHDHFQVIYGERAVPIFKLPLCHTGSGAVVHDAFS